MELDGLVLAVWQAEIDNKQKPLSCWAQGLSDLEPYPQLFLL